jgi:long-chain fatty acid transport protein
MASLRSLLVVTLVLVLPRLAFPAAAYVGDIEARSIGQAGATIASPETLAAIYYNPAALAGPRGLRLEIEGGAQVTPESYTRSGTDASGSSYRTVTNQDPFKPAMLGGVGWDLTIPNLEVALVAFSPIAAHYVFTDTGAQRYQYIRGDNTVIHMHLGVAYRLFDILSLGVAFGNTYFKTHQRVAVQAAPGGDPESLDFSVPIDVNVEEAFRITSSFGIRVEPLRTLAIGVSLMPPWDVSAAGTAQIELPDTLKAFGVQISGDKVTLNLHLPMILRAGIRYTPLDLISVEAAFVWEQWSRYKTVDLVPNITLSAPALGINGVPLPVVSQKKNYRDSYAVRLGVESKILSWLMARVGGYIETAATRPEYFDISNPDTLKFAASAGVSLRVWKFWIDAAYSHTFTPDLVITTSKTIAVNVVPNSPPGSVLGNGTYSFQNDMFHLGVRATFLDAPAAPPPEPAPAAPPAAAEVTAPSTEPTSPAP